MKKIISLVVLFLVVFTLAGCKSGISSSLSSTETTSNESSIESSNKTESSSESSIESSSETESSTNIIPPLSTIGENSFEVLGMNDVHGQLTDKSDFAKTAGYINQEKYNNDALFISQGDQFQGSAVSNLSTGGIYVDALNAAGLDSLTIGNHEFDWGIDKIQRFRDGDLSNGEADFPILCANVVRKDTNEIIENFDAYTILESAGYKIGVIGVIGEECYSSILPANVADYNFLDPAPIVGELAAELRTEKDCDFVIVSIHYGSIINEKLTSLPDGQKPDAIFLGHFHKKESGFSHEVPYVQGGANGTYVSQMVFDVGGEEISNVEIKNIETKYLSNPPLKSVSNAIKIGTEKYDSVINEKLTYFDGSNSNFKLAIAEYSTKLVVNALQESNGLVFCSVNLGGFRSTPDLNSDFTYGKLYEIIPFDNTIQTCKVSGSALKLLLENKTDLMGDDHIDYCSLSIDEIKNNEMYTVGAISYVFQNATGLTSGEDITDTYFVFREIIKEDLLLHETWNPNTSVPMLTEYTGR